jgi:hypothetical protein
MLSRAMTIIEVLSPSNITFFLPPHVLQLIGYKVPKLRRKNKYYLQRMSQLYKRKWLFEEKEERKRNHKKKAF